MREFYRFQFYAILLLGVTTVAVAQSDGVFEEALVGTTDEHILIGLNFICGMRYVSHFPLSASDEVRIQIRPLPECFRDGEAIHSRALIRPPGRRIASLIDIVYDNDAPGGPYVTFRFEVPVLVDVSQDRGLRSLSVLVPKPPIQRTTRPGVRESVSPADSLEKPKTEATVPSLAPVSDEKLEQLIEQARVAVSSGEFGRGIEIYTKLLRYPKHRYSEDAQELLGLTREKKGQLAHAIAEYKKYLESYPEGEGAQRVKQRLSGLLTADKTDKTKLRASKTTADSPWQFYGAMSHFYRRNVDTTDEEQDNVNLSAWSSDFDLNARRRGEVWDLRTRITAGYQQDLVVEDNDQARVSSAFVSLENVNLNLSTRMGRQSNTGSGILGRFDGVSVAYQTTDWANLRVSAGYPVDRTRDETQTNRRFYSLSVDLEPEFLEAWSLTPYVLSQTLDGFTDRRSVGIETRFSGARKSLFSLLDYDVEFNELNNVLLLGNWTLPNRVALHASYDLRKSPLLSTRNALIGQIVTTLPELLQSFDEEQIHQLALDRTAQSTLISVGFSKPLWQKFQLLADVSMNDLSGTPASGGVFEVPEIGRQFNYALNFVGSGLIKQGDITTFGLRFIDSPNVQITSLSFNSRYPIKQWLRLSPRLRVDQRTTFSDDMTQWVYAPSLRVDMRFKRRHRVELEFGNQITNEQDSLLREDTSSYFFSLGYFGDF